MTTLPIAEAEMNVHRCRRALRKPGKLARVVATAKPLHALAGVDRYRMATLDHLIDGLDPVAGAIVESIWTELWEAQSFVNGAGNRESKVYRRGVPLDAEFELARRVRVLLTYLLTWLTADGDKARREVVAMLAGNVFASDELSEVTK